MKEINTIIIGGGVTGVSLASFLDQKDYLIIEGSDSIGGYCKTHKVDGFTWDYSGHFFHFNDESIKDIATSNIECEILEIQKISKIFYKGEYIDFPFQNNIHQLEKSEFIDCLSDIYNTNKNLEATNFSELSFSKFGKSISEKFIIPYNTKLYSCDLSQLDHNCMGRFLPKADFNSIMKSISGEKYNSYNDTFIYPVNGCFEFIKSISKNIPIGKIHVDESVVSIDIDAKTLKTNKNEYKFNNLVSTIPFTKLLSICGVSSNLLKSNKVVVFNIGFDKPSETDAHWIYYPGGEVFYRVGFYDNILNSDKMSLYVEVSFKIEDEVDEYDLYQFVVEDLKKCGVIKDHEVLAYEMLILDPAYVHITKDSIKLYEEWCLLNNPKGIYSIGRYGSWTYCSIEDNIIQSKKISEIL